MNLCNRNWNVHLTDDLNIVITVDIYLPVAMVTRRNGLCRWCFDRQCDLWDKCPSVMNENLSNLAQTYTVHKHIWCIQILYYNLVWEIFIIYISWSKYNVTIITLYLTTSKLNKASLFKHNLSRYEQTSMLCPANEQALYGHVFLSGQKVVLCAISIPISQSQYFVT